MTMNEQNKSQTEIQQFLQEKIPNVQDVFANAFADFRNLYLGKVTTSRTAPKPEEKIEDTNSN
jgi:hypothetical protein